MSVVKEGISQSLIEEYRLLSKENKNNPDGFHKLFDDSPVSYWEFDGSAVLKYSKKLKRQGVKNFNSYFSKNPIEVYQCAGLMKLQNVNNQTLNLFDAENHYQFSQNLNKVFGDNAYPIFKEVILTFLKGKKKYYSDVLLKTVCGRELSIYITFSLLDEKNYGWSKIIVSATDLTQLMSIEDKYKTRYKLSDITQNVPAYQDDITQNRASGLKENIHAKHYLDLAAAIILVMNINGDVEVINKKGCEILGCKLNWIIGKNWIDNFIEEKNRDELRTMFKAIGKKKAVNFEYNENPIITKKGEKKYIAWHNAVIEDETGNVVGISCTGYDITFRKKAEERQKEVKKINVQLETITTGAISDLSRLMSEPLKGLSYNLYEIQKNSRQPANRQIQPIVQDCFKTLNDVQFQINNLVFYSNDLKNSIEAIREKVYIEEFFQEIIEKQICMVKKNCNIKCIIKSEIGKIYTDKNLIKYILLNLLSNAIKFSGENRQIELIFDGVKDKFFMIIVVDNGLGINANELDHIYTPFYRGKNTLENQGTGLGLAIVKKSVELLNGNINIETKLEQGTSVSIDIPIE